MAGNEDTGLGTPPLILLLLPPLMNLGDLYRIIVRLQKHTSLLVKALLEWSFLCFVEIAVFSRSSKRASLCDALA